MTLLHRWKGYNHTAHLIWDLILNSCWDLDHFLIDKLTFWELSPDNVGNKQWGEAGGTQAPC